MDKVIAVAELNKKVETLSTIKSKPIYVVAYIHYCLFMWLLSQNMTKYGFLQTVHNCAADLMMVLCCVCQMCVWCGRCACCFLSLCS